MEELVFGLIAMAVIGLVLFVGGLAVDYVLPRSKRFNDYIEKLPMSNGEDDQ